MKNSFQWRNSFLRHFSKLKLCLTAFSCACFWLLSYLRNISCSNLCWKDNEVGILITFQESSRSINSIHDLYYGTAYRWAKSGVSWQVPQLSKPYKSEMPFCSRYKIWSNVHKCHIFCVLLQSYKTLPWLRNSFHLPLGNVNTIWQPHHIKDEFAEKNSNDVHSFKKRKIHPQSSREKVWILL